MSTFSRQCDSVCGMEWATIAFNGKKSIAFAIHHEIPDNYQDTLSLFAHRLRGFSQNIKYIYFFFQHRYALIHISNSSSVCQYALSRTKYQF